MEAATMRVHGSRDRPANAGRDVDLETGAAKVQSSPLPAWAKSARATAGRIIRGYRTGRAIPSGENLQGMSKEIQDGLKPGFRLVISSAAKPRRLSIEIPFQPTRIGAEAKASKGDAWRSQQALIPRPEH